MIFWDFIESFSSWERLCKLLEEHFQATVVIKYCKEQENMIGNTKLFDQTYIQDIVNTEPLDWIAFKEFVENEKFDDNILSEDVQQLLETHCIVRI
jgi:hypothetical protein